MSFVGVANKFLDDNKVSKFNYFQLAADRRATSEIGCSEALYALYSHSNELLYIGWAKHITNRLGSHFNSRTNTSSFKNEISYAKYTFRVKHLRSKFDALIKKHDNELEVWDLEYFTIGVLKPKYNKVLCSEFRLKIANEEAH